MASPAHQAAQQGDVEALQRLLSGGRRAPADEETGETPLHTAARACQIAALRWLLHHTSIDPQTRAENGETAAHLTAFEGWLEGLQALCDYDERRRVLMVTDQDRQGLTPLHVAIIRGHIEYVKWILENFSAERLHLNERGSLAVHFAAASGSLAILRIVVDHAGPDCINQADDNNATPVYFAAQDGKLEAIKFLVTECGANAKSKSADGMQPLHAATQNGHLEVVKWLVARLGRSSLLEAADDGATPVHFAAAAGHSDILAWFFATSAQNSANLAKAKDNMQSTPIHDAIDYGHLVCVKILLKHGADLFLTDKENCSPYSLAMEHSDPAIKECVIEHIRANHLTPPDPTYTMIPTSSATAGTIYENVNHPVIPRTGSTKPSASQQDSSIRTLQTLTQEIEAAQEEVMAHKLSSALEAAASGTQSIRVNRPTRQQSFKELKLPVDHSPRKAGAVPAPPAPPAPPPVFNVNGVVKGADDELLTMPKLISSSRDEPEGQEHGTLNHEVNSWFAGTSSKGDEESSIGNSNIQPRSQGRQRREQKSWYSSDDGQEMNLPAMAAEQLLSGKPQQKRKLRRQHMVARNAPQRFQYMPVYQPVLTPYGYMLAQSMMPVPVYGRQRRSSSRMPSHQGNARRENTPSSGGRRVLRKDSGRVPENSPGLTKGFSRSIHSLASLDEEGVENQQQSRRRTSANERSNAAIESKLSSRNRSQSAVNSRSPQMSPFGFSPYGSMYNQQRQGSSSSFMTRLFHKETPLTRTRSMSSMPANRHPAFDGGHHSDLDGTLSTSALGETYERGSTIVALAVSTAVTAMSAVSAVPRRKLMPTLADGAQRAISHFGLGEPVNLDDLQDPVKRKKIEAEAAREGGDPGLVAVPTRHRSSSDLHAAKRRSTASVDSTEKRTSTAWEFDRKMESEASQRWGNALDEDVKDGLAMGEGIAASTHAAAEREKREEKRRLEAEERQRKKEEEMRRREEEQRKKEEEQKRKEEERKRQQAEAEERKRQREEEDRQREEERERQRQEEEERRRKRREEEEQRKEEERERKRKDEEERRQLKEEQERKKQEEREAKKREEEERKRKREEEKERKRAEEEQRKEEEKEKKRQEEEEKRRKKEDEKRKKEAEKERKKQEEGEKKRQKEEQKERKKKEQEEKRREEEEEKKRRKESGSLLRGNSKKDVDVSPPEAVKPKPLDEFPEFDLPLTPEKESKPAQPDDDDPFGLSELALALELAGEAEYWKESLTFEEGTEDPHAKPAFASKASVEASAAAAVVFDESGLIDALSQPAYSTDQPSHGSLARPKPEEPDNRQAVLATASALADFGDDAFQASSTPPPRPPPIPAMLGGVAPPTAGMARERGRSSRGQATSAIRQMSIGRDSLLGQTGSTSSLTNHQPAWQQPNNQPGVQRPLSGRTDMRDKPTLDSAGSTGTDELQRIFAQRKKKAQTNYINQTN